MTKLVLLQLVILTNIYSLSIPQKICNGVGEIRYKNATYVGECTDNKKEGQGVITFKNGVKYDGSWSKNKKNGFGTQHYANGVVYSGEWIDGLYSGHGKIEYNKIQSYEGSFKRGKRDGHGVYDYGNGIIYDGEWVADKKHGQATLTYANGAIYTGEFTNNEQTGKGKLVYPSGDIYEGSFKNSKKDGYGVFTYANGSVYEGEYKNNKKNGHGIYRYASGSIYDGNWVNDAKEGLGTYTQSDGTIYNGHFKANKRSGQGILTSKNGEKYDGSWLNDAKEGKGVLTYSDGKLFYGSWHKNKIDGEGSSVSQYGICRGVWKESKLLKTTNELSKKEIYAYFNELRTQAGMIPLKQNKILEKSAKSHSYYIELHADELKGLSYHDEVEGKKGFSGVKAVDRAISAGYYSRGVGEGIATFCTAKESINSLMTAIYHRFGVLSFAKDEVGVGYTQNPARLKRNFVHNMGNTKLNELCKEDGAWIGYYYEKVCKDETKKIKKDPYESAKTSIQRQNPEYVLWPSANSKNNLYYYRDEVPNPIPDYKKTGNPISIEFNPYYFPASIVMHSFRLYKNNKEITNTRILTKQTDPNKKFNSRQYALFPLDTLERNSIYDVEFIYSYNGFSDKIKWRFTTMK